MRKILFVMILLSSNLRAVDWKDTWIEAIEACNDKDYLEAEHSFDNAIVAMPIISENLPLFTNRRRKNGQGR